MNFSIFAVLTFAKVHIAAGNSAIGNQMARQQVMSAIDGLISALQTFSSGSGHAERDEMPGYTIPKPSLPRPPSSQYTCQGSQFGTCPPGRQCMSQSAVGEKIIYACQQQSSMPKVR